MHPHQHIQIATANLPPSSPVHSPTNSRGGNSHMHGHQRIGPGAHIHHESVRDPDYEMAIQRGRELERIREREREEEMHIQMAREREEEMHMQMARGREERGWNQDHGLVGPGIPHAAGTHTRSRSDTPGSGSGHDNNLSRPPSGQSYERGDRDSRSARYASSAAVHHQNLLGLEHEQPYGDQIHSSSRDRHLRHAGHGGGHGHSHSHGSHGYPPDPSGERGGRKRGYAEMDVDDSERGGGSGSASGSMRSPLDSHPASVAAGLSGDSLDHHHHRKRMRSPMLSRVRDESMDEDD